MKRLILSGSSFMLLVSLFITWFAFPQLLTSEVSPDSFPTTITELAANDDTIFLLDNHMDTIFAYSYDGEVKYTISFTSSGNNYIYTEGGLLHRYDARKMIVYAYIDDAVDSEIQTTYDFVPPGHGIDPNDFVTSIEVGDTSIRFIDHLFRASIVDIDGTYSKQFTVESVSNHAIFTALVMIFISAFLIGIYSLIGLLKSGMNRGSIKWTWEWWGFGKKKS